MFLKNSLIGADGGPVKLDKLNSVERRKQFEINQTEDGSMKRNRASLPPLQMFMDKRAGRNNAIRQSSPSFLNDRSHTSPQASKMTRRGKTAAQGSATRGGASMRHASPGKKTEALLFQIQIQMRERDVQTRLDVNYPYERKDVQG